MAEMFRYSDFKPRTPNKKGSIDMNTTDYKGYEIEANPDKLRDKEGWAVNFTIWKHHSSSSANKNFPRAEICKTEKEAISKCFEIGKWIIENDFEQIAEL